MRIPTWRILMLCHSECLYCFCLGRCYACFFLLPRDGISSFRTRGKSNALRSWALILAQRANRSFTHNRSAMPVHYIEFGITEQQRSAAVSRQELVKRNRQVADTDAGRVIDGVGDSSSGAGDPKLANPFRTHRVEMWIVFIDPGHIDGANIGVRRDVVLCEVVVHVVAEARVHDALLV